MEAAPHEIAMAADYNSLENPIGIETPTLAKEVDPSTTPLQLIRKPDRD